MQEDLSILGFARAELSRILREKPRMLLLLAPFIAFALCAWVYSGRVVRDLPVGVIDQDQTSLSRTLVRDLAATPQIAVLAFEDEKMVQQAFREGRIRAGVLIPDGLDEDVREGRKAHVVVWRDASNPITANQIYSAEALVVASEMARLETARLMVAGVPFVQAKDLALVLRSDSRPLGNPFIDYLRNMAPGLFVMFLQMGLMLAGGNLLPLHWAGTRRPRRELLGRVLPWVFLHGGLGILAFAWLFPSWGIPIPALSSLIGLLALLVAASLGFGAMVGKWIPTQVQAAQILLAFNTPAFVFSGYSFPEWAMPPWLEALTRPLPFSFFMDAYRDVVGDLSTRADMGWIGLFCYAVIPWILLLALPGPKTHRNDETLPSHSGEVVRVFREGGLGMLVLVAPLMYLAMYGAVYVAKEEREQPVAVTGELNSSLPRKLLRELDAHPRIHAIPMSAFEAREALRRGDVRGILEFPPDLDERVRNRRVVQVPLLIPATRFLPVSDLQRAVNDVFNERNRELREQVFLMRGMSMQAAQERAEPLVLEDRPLFNPSETYGDFILPGLGMLIMHQLLLVAIAFATGSAVRRAAVPGDLGNPLRRVFWYALWFSLWVLLWVGIGLPYFGVPGTFHFWTLLLLAFPGFLAVACLGVASGYLLRSGRPVLQLLAFSSYPFFFVSGMSWPREAFSPALDLLGSLVPLRPLALGLGRNFRMDAGLADLAPEIAHLWILALAYAILAFVAHRLASRRLLRQ